MSLYLLDTDHVSLWEKATVEGIRIRDKVRQLPPDDYGITIITYAEQAKGWLAEANRAHTPAGEVEAFGQMQQSLTFVSPLLFGPTHPKRQVYAPNCSVRKSAWGRRTCELRPSRWQTTPPF